MLKKIIFLELLVVIAFVFNGAFSQIYQIPLSAWSYSGLFPLWLGLMIWLIYRKNWVRFFRSPDSDKKEMLTFSGPFLLTLTYIAVVNKGIEVQSVSWAISLVLVHLMVVAFIEEVIFRGIMIENLLVKGPRVALWGSTILFSGTHALQLIGGQSPAQTIIQILFAFVFGLLLALWAISGKSLILPICFHAANNTLVQLGAEETHMIHSIIAIVLMGMFLPSLWKKALLRYQG